MNNETQKNKSNTVPWYRRLRTGIEISPVTVTGKEVIDNLAKAKVDYAVIFMKDGDYAYYNSQFATKAPYLGERDLLRECLDEAKKHDIPIIAYCQVQYDGSSWEAHPEWRMKDVEGNDIKSRLCYNSDYLEQVKRLAAEMMEYEIAGFHFDMLDFGFGAPYGCWCDTCKQLFKEKYGIDMPQGMTWDDAWDKMLEFRCDSNASFAEELRRFVHEHRPEISVDFNYHGYPPFSWQVGERPVQHAVMSDFVTAEGLPWVFGYKMPSLISLFMAGTNTGAPYQCVTSRFVRNYADKTIRPVADTKWEVFTYLSHGGMCTIVDKSDYGGLEPVVFERIGEVFGEVSQKREYFGHKPVQEVGLYYSSRSRDWFGREDKPKYFRAFAGAHKALVESHISLGVIFDENISAERLREFPVVYIPNATILNDREVELFTKYVADGGNLLVTGLTGCYDRMGQPLDTFTLSDLIGAQLIERLEDDENYFRLPSTMTDELGRSLLQDIPPDCSLLTRETAAVFEATEAKSYGKIMSKDKAVGPAVFINRYDKGESVYLPCSPDGALGGEFRMPEHRFLIRNILRYLNPKPEVVIDAPLNVESVITYDDTNNRFIIHFVSYFSPTPPTIGSHVLMSPMEETFQYNATVEVQFPITRTEALNSTTQIAQQGNKIELEINEIHEALVVYS